MPAGGDSRFRRVPLISGSHRAVPTRRSSCVGSLSCGALVHRRTHPGTPRDTTPSPRSASSNVRAGRVPSPLHPPAPGRQSQRRPPRAPRPAVRRSSPSPYRLGRSPGALPDLRSRRPRRGQRGAGTVRRSLRHRPDTRIPRSCGHDHRLGSTDPGLPPQQTSIQRTPRRDQQPPPAPTKESLTGSPTTTTSQPEDS